MSKKWRRTIAVMVLNPHLNRRDILKLIALVSMLIDHTFIFFGNKFWIRLIGRIAFPIYCWLLYDGYLRTSNEKKYMGRLSISALASQWQYHNLFGGYSVMVTLLFGFIGLMNPIAGVVLALLGTRLHIDYKGVGVLVIMLMKIHYSVALAVLAVYESSQNVFYAVSVLLAVPLIWWCKQDTSEFHGSIALRRIWYLAYPVHLFVYYLIKIS